VGEFVKQQPRKIGFRPAQKRAQQRIIEPAKRRVRRYFTKIGIKTTASELLAKSHGAAAIEITPVRRTPDKWITPGFSLQ